MLDLRDYQSKAVEAVREAYRTGSKAPLLVAPTGAGKTVIFSYITATAAAKGNRTMILVHRAELLAQTHKALVKMNVPHGLVASGRTPDPTQTVQVASVQTLIRRLDKFPAPDLIIIDEAHHASAGSWQAVIKAYPNARLLGVTATPARLDGKGLSSSFDRLIHGPEVIDLIEQNWLVKPVYYAPSTVDMTGAKTTAGDWNRKEAEERTNKPKITGDAVTHYQRLCAGSPAVVFCVSVAHAQSVADAFNSAGYRAAVIDGTLAPDVRAERVNALASGELQILTSCDIISEGFDLPKVTTAILLRPTQSLSLHLQQIGRVLRPSENKPRAYILDHVGNCLRHGFAEETREWSLDGIKRKSKKEQADDIEKYKQCPTCFAVHLPAPTCPQCGHTHEVKARTLDEVDGTLTELEVNFEAMRLKREERQIQGRAQSVHDLIALGKARGYKNPQAWARFVFKGRRSK